MHMMRRLVPLMSSNQLPEELMSSSRRKIKVRIGAPVTVREQADLDDISQYGRYLRARVYSLGSTIETKAFMPAFRKRVRRIQPVIEPLPTAILAREFSAVRENYELFSAKNYSAVCAPADAIPNIFREIGRLREVTFRAVGEGTNKSIDIDEYDFYYHHLFLWDTAENRLIGAYRLGKGKEIISSYGIKGFYINSLFGIRREMAPILSESIELGRSFITREYQKKPMPLFLLWKGIMVFLLRHSEYRYLIGPVSISNDLSSFSKTLIVDFIRRYFFNHELSGFIVPRKGFIPAHDTIVDRNVFIDTSEKDINRIENIIMGVDPGYRIPVLLKKYIEINGKIIGFNIDPDFNNCLDGLLILDLFQVPEEYIKGLSREMNDPAILERFRK
jgi:putative hemolysin